jgi:hypothetical protein
MEDAMKYLSAEEQKLPLQDQAALIAERKKDEEAGLTATEEDITPAQPVDMA